MSCLLSLVWLLHLQSHDACFNFCFALYVLNYYHSVLDLGQQDFCAVVMYGFYVCV